MADLKKAIEIIFQGKDVSLSRTIKGIERDIGSIDSAFGGLGGHAAKLTKTLALTGAAAAAAATVFAAFAVNEAADFQTAFSEITTLLKLNSEQASKFKNDILSYASESSFGIEQITTATYNAISAGVDYEDSIDAVRKAEQLAVAGKAELIDTVNLLIPTLNAFAEQNLSSKDAADAFFTAVKDGKTTISELAAAFPKISATASAAGVSLDELLAAIAAITAGGANTAEAVTGLKAALSNIIKPSAQATETAKSLGIEFNATALKTLGLSGFMKNLQEKTGGNIEIMGKLFGSTEALNGVMTLAKDTSGVFAKSLDDMENKTGNVDVAFKKMANTFNYVVSVLKNTWRVFLITVGDPILKEVGPVIKDLIKQIQSLESRILASEIGNAFATWIKALVEFSERVQEIYRDITGIKDASLLVDFIKWAGDVETVKGALTIVNSIVQGLALGVALIHDAFIGATKVVAVGMTGAVLTVNEVVFELIKLLNKIPGIDLSGPLEDLQENLKISQSAWEAAKDSMFSLDKEKLWSDNVVKSISAIDSAIAGIGTDGIKLPSITARPAPGGIVGAQRQTEDFSAQQKIQRSIEKEADIKQKASEKDAELVDKKKELMDAEIDRLSSDEGITITVNAEGLVPHLEAIFQAVMDFGQVQTNARGEQFLLALPGA